MRGAGYIEILNLPKTTPNMSDQLIDIKLLERTSDGLPAPITTPVPAHRQWDPKQIRLVRYTSLLE